MKINFIATRLNMVNGGGSHRTLDLKIRYFVERGHDVTLTTLYSSGNQWQDKPPCHVIEKNFAGQRFTALQNSVALYLKEAEREFDLFHLDGTAFLWGGGIYKKNDGTKPVVAFLNNYTDGMNIVKRHPPHLWGAFKRFMYIRKRYGWEKTIGLGLLNRLDHIYADSPVVKKIYREFGVHEETMSVLPEFIDVEAISVDGVQQKKSVFELMYAGRLTAEKGVDLLIGALARLEGQAEYHVSVFGEGSAKGSLLRLVKKCGLANVSFHPWLSPRELTAQYYASDVFVHPCRWPEPFGRTVVEAMACGVPVITAEDSGSAWIVGRKELIFKKNDIADLAVKINAIKNNPALKAELSVYSRGRASEFDYRRYAPELEQHLQKLAGR